MKIVELYKYENDDGSISISPENRPGGINIEYKYRLIADEGKVITGGENTFYCIDTEDVGQFFEIEKPKEDNQIFSEETIQKAKAFNYIIGEEK